MEKTNSWIQKELEAIKASGLWRSLRTVASPQGNRIILNGVEVINLCSNDYLGLANHQILKEAAIHAIKKFGCGSGASRLICGNNILYEELETLSAGFVGQERAIVFSSGYSANTGSIPAIVDSSGIVFSDELNHASIIDGIRLSRGTIAVYKHGSFDDLEKKARLNNEKKRGIIITESLFSMDGDAAPLAKLCGIAMSHNLILMIDEAHAIGVMGPQGRGLFSESGITDAPTALMGTFGKALGSFGAFVAGPRDYIEFLINRARSFIFSTALPPAALAASIAAIKLVQADDTFRNHLWENIRYFSNELRILGFDTGASHSQIIPIIIGDNEKTMEFCKNLLERGVYIQGIRPPTVPQGTARIRISLSASHTRDDLDHALEALRMCGKKFQII